MAALPQSRTESRTVARLSRVRRPQLGLYYLYVHHFFVGVQPSRRLRAARGWAPTARNVAAVNDGVVVRRYTGADQRRW